MLVVVGAGAMESPSKVIPRVELEAGARHRRVYPRTTSHVPHIPSPACVVALRSEHIFLTANELKRVKLQCLRVLRAVIQVEPEVKLEVRDGIVRSQLVPPQTVCVGCAVDIKIATRAIDGRSGLER